MFEPKSDLHEGAIEITDSILELDSKCCAFLPVCNSSGTPVWLKRGQTLGCLQPVELMSQPLPEQSDKSNWEEGVLPFAEEQEQSTPEDATVAAVAMESRQHTANLEATTERLQRLKEGLALDTVEAGTNST